MKKFVWVILLLLSVQLMAQFPPNYTVQKGDTLYALSGTYLQDPEKFRDLIEQNPQLAEPGRQWTDKQGRFIVLLKPGEKLNVEGLGVVPEPLPISSLRVEQTQVQSVQTLNRFDRTMNYLVEPTNQFALPWLLIFLVSVLILSVLWMFMHSVKYSQPTMRRSGPPVREGGIEPTAGREVHDRFNEIARDYQRHDLGVQSGPMPTIVGPIETGFLHGPGLVGYDRQQVAEMQPRFFRNEPAYRATFRFTNPDGTTRDEQLFFLQGCANDVRFMHRRYLNFSFTAERQVEVPAPQPEPQPAVAEQPVRPQFGIIDGNRGEQTTLVIGDHEMLIPVNARITIGEKGGAGVDLGDGIVLEIKRNKVKKVKTARPEVAAAPPVSS